MSLRVGVLGSTRGTALKGVLDAIAAGTLDPPSFHIDLRIVISDRPTAPILDRARLYKVPSLFLDPTGLSREQYDERVSAELRKARVELVLLVGYMRILSPHFVAEWHGRLLNVHPSLLPAFAGLMNRKVHEAVLSAGVPETGCTIHQVTEEVDGGPIVLQKRCPVLPGDTVDTLKDRVQALEQSAFIDVLRNWNSAERSPS